MHYVLSDKGEFISFLFDLNAAWVLGYLQKHPRSVQIKQKGDKLTFVAQNIMHLQGVYEVFQRITTQEALH